MRWPWKTSSRSDDPYWEAFIHRPPADLNNLIPHAFKQVTPGGVNPVKTEVHSPNVMSQQVKELAQFYGADLVGIVATDRAPRFAIVCVLKSDHDTRQAHGIGGQAPAVKGLFATYTLGCYIRELGYTADSSDVDRERLAVAAGLGTLTPDGRLKTSKLGTNTYVAEILLTDLPLEPDGHT